ncbi:MAG: PHP domain-containing protein [Myxococcales bacterium]
MIDLHSHSLASDGQHSPTELVRLAAAAGVTHLALTDHDTVAGIDEARRAADAAGIELIAGIEISASLEKREVHILGHFVDPGHPQLAAFGERMRRERVARIEAMIVKLRRLDVAVSLDDVLPFSGGTNLGRPHLARALVARRYCRDLREAFDRYLGNGRPAYVEHQEFTTREAIALVHEAGGTATIAHPLPSRLAQPHLEKLAKEGLDGVEADHPEHTEAQRGSLVKTAYKLGMVPTGGSDFHGEAVTPDRRPGCGRTKSKDLEALRARAKPLPV